MVVLGVFIAALPSPDFLCRHIEGHGGVLSLPLAFHICMWHVEGQEPIPPYISKYRWKLLLLARPCKCTEGQGGALPV